LEGHGTEKINHETRVALAREKGKHRERGNMGNKREGKKLTVQAMTRENNPDEWTQ